MNLKDIRLIALDLDGTTFNSGKIITERTRKALMAAIDKGVIVLPATGRPKRGLPESFLSIPGVRYALTSNGGVMFDLWEDKIIYSNLMDGETAVRVLDYLLGLDAMIDVCHDGGYYVDRRGYERLLNEYRHVSPWFREYVKQSRIPTDGIAEKVRQGELRAEKISASFDDMDIRSRALQKLQSYKGLSVVTGTDFNIELTSDTATKGDCLMGFAEMMAIKPEQVMACGDSMNDKTMLEKAGLGIAMGNAEPEIKLLADYITLTNDEDGVAYAIEKFVL